MIPTSRDIWSMVEPHLLALAATSQNLTDVGRNTRRREPTLGRGRNCAGLNLRSEPQIIGASLLRAAWVSISMMRFCSAARLKGFNKIDTLCSWPSLAVSYFSVWPVTKMIFSVLFFVSRRRQSCTPSMPGIRMSMTASLIAAWAAGV